MEGSDFTGSAAFRQALADGPAKLELDQHTIDVVESWFSRLESLVERLEYAQRGMNEAGEKNQHAASSMREAAGTMDSASRRMH